MKYKILVFVMLMVLFSCSKKDQFPPFLMEKVSPANIILKEDIIYPENRIIPDSNKNIEFSHDLNRLLAFQNQYLEKVGDFSEDDFENLWESIKTKKDGFEINCRLSKKWFEITGLLLRLTGNAKYADELEKIVFTDFRYRSQNLKTKIRNVVIPYIFTKNADHIYVNFFTPSEINYVHTLKGKVKISQETNYPKSGEVQLKFNMEKKRYIELFVRIPAWAENATVTVKKVKYLAPPGGYCKIAKKWKEGDIVEIYFPIDLAPKYLTTTASNN